MKKLAVTALILSTLACRFTLPALPGGSEPEPGSPPQTAKPVDTIPAPTAEVPQPAPTAAPSYPALLEHSCSGSSRDSWCLLENSTTYAIALPPGNPQLYDFAPRTKLALYGSEFPDHGAGPGEKAVTDLWIYDVTNGATSQVMAEELVVRARWAPNGSDFAYVRAAPDTYELVWNSGGAETVLAADAHFVFEISNQGDRIAFTREPDMGLGPGMGLYAVDVQTGNEQFLSAIDREGGGSIADQPVWSPDDSTILLPMIPEENPITTLVAAADGSGSANLSFDPSVDADLRAFPLPSPLLWHPDGTHIIAQTTTGDMMMGDGQHLIVRYSFDASQALITAAEILTEDARLIAWQTPGDTFWVIPLSGDTQTPQLQTLQ